MQIFRTNKYNSLNIFNYFIGISFILILINFSKKIPIFDITLYIIIFGTILLVSFFTVDKKQKYNTKNNSLQKFITFITIAFYLFVITFILYFLVINFSLNNTFTNPHDYKKAISKIRHQEKVSHFPETIPQNASNIKLYSYISDFNGEMILLKFNIDKNYIEQELQNHTFIKSDISLKTPQNIYRIFNNYNRIKTDNTTWHVINDRENKEIYKKCFPYYSGIGISNNMDFIIYYYIRPED